MISFNIQKGDLIEIITSGHYNRTYKVGEVWRVLEVLHTGVRAVKYNEGNEYHYTILCMSTNEVVEAIPFGDLYDYKQINNGKAKY